MNLFKPRYEWSVRIYDGTTFRESLPGRSKSYWRGTRRSNLGILEGQKRLPEWLQWVNKVSKCENTVQEIVTSQISQVLLAMVRTLDPLCVINFHKSVLNKALAWWQKHNYRYLLRRAEEEKFIYSTGVWEWWHPGRGRPWGRSENVGNTLTNKVKTRPNNGGGRKSEGCFRKWKTDEWMNRMLRV